MGGTVAGATWYLGRLAMGPHGASRLVLRITPRGWLADAGCGVVVWSKDNPQPWNTVKHDETVKMMNVNQDLQRR
jgi:NADH dehydrogenase (ubiquinone) 1 alpha subcomplex subunit 4